MKKILFSIALIASGLVASAQVGVGTTNPQVSLQVDRSTVATDADGVLVPRVTVAELNAKATAYGANQNGTLVFVNNLTGTAENETSNVRSIGFYYYDATADKWIGVGSSPAASVIVATQINPTYNGETVIIDNNTGPHNFNLPNPANYVNKIIFYRNNSVNAGSGGTATFVNFVPPNNTTVLQNRGMVFFSNGTTWFNVGGV
jgi:hypothetical protein